MKNSDILKAAFERIAKEGAMMSVMDDTSSWEYGIVDSFTVVRETTEKIWVMLKAGGYNNGPQYVSLLRIDAWTSAPGLLSMVDSRGRTCDVVPLKDDQKEVWSKWMEYKEKHSGDLQSVDKRLLRQARKDAKEWIDEA